MSNTMLIFETKNKFYNAEIRTTDHPTSKYVATFITATGISPRCVMTCGWDSLEYAHKMIDWQATKYNK